MSEKPYYPAFPTVPFKQLRTLIERSIFKVIEVNTDDKFDQEDGWTPHLDDLHFILAVHPPIWRKWSLEFVGSPKYGFYHKVVKTMPLAQK